MNGYFQIINEEDATYVMLVPPTDGGAALDINEVVDYLVFCDIPHELTTLYAYSKKLATEPIKVKLHDGKGDPKSDICQISVVKNDMLAVARFWAPSNDGNKMSFDEIMGDLKARGVIYGIKEEVIRRYLSHPEYCTNIDIAEGLEKVGGEPERIEYCFNTDGKAKPTLKEDGSVDFFHLNILNNCNKGDVLAKIIKGNPPVPGKDVRGRLLQVMEGKKVHLTAGKNTELSEDAQQLIASTSGHILLDGDHVSVEDILTLKNVDSSTGNIDYAGTVEISGNVCENFSVNSGGDVIIKGLVEGAYITAKGNVIITRGMNGMGKGVIKAGGNVVARFFENSKVFANGYVQADSIMHSNVTSRDKVLVGGKKGNITGGVVCARKGVEAMNIGSAMGGDTLIEVGVDPTLKQEMSDIQQKITETDGVIKQTGTVLATLMDKIKKGIKLPPEQLDYVKKLNAMYTIKKQDLEKLNMRLDEIQLTMESGREASVKVQGDVYAGTKIAIGDVSLVVRKNTVHCRFARDRGDVKMFGI